MSEKISNLSLAQFIWGIFATLVVCVASVIGSYISLREGDIERNGRIENLEKRVDKAELLQKEASEENKKYYLEILEKLTAIQVKLESKKDKE
jgi:hypothetical protein